jgi:hypothetical protein
LFPAERQDLYLLKYVDKLAGHCAQEYARRIGYSLVDNTPSIRCGELDNQ